MNAIASWPKVTVVIPNWNTQCWLPGCLDSLRAQRYRDFQVILVDDGSTDNSLEFVQQHYPEVQIVSFPKNQGFASAVNAGITGSRSEYVALLNVDTVSHPDWLSSLVEAMEDNPNDVGGLASKMLAMDHPTMIDDVGNTLSWYGSARKRGMGQPGEAHSQVEEVFSVSAGAALYRRSFLEEAGGFDEGFGSYLEDIDLGLRGRLLGYRYLYVPTAVVLHKIHGAGLARSRYVYLVTRNRLALLVKNIPMQLLIRHSWTLLYGQVYFLLAYKKPLHSLAGIVSFGLALPRILRQRRAIQQRKSISNRALEAMLTNELGEPGLREIVKKRLGRP